MSTWGTHRFGDDVAPAWLANLESEGPEALRGTLSRVANASTDESLGPDDAFRALAAAEVVAAALDRSLGDLPTELAARLAHHVECFEQADRVLARRAVRRVLLVSDLFAAGRGREQDLFRSDVLALEDRLGSDEDSTVGAPVPPVGAVRDGDRRLLLSFLRARGLEVTASELARIEWCQDPGEMRRWLASAMTAHSVAHVLDD